MKNVFINILLILHFSTVLVATEEPLKNILIIHSYHQGLEWTESITQGINDVFKKSEKKYNIYFEYLDTKRNTSVEYFEGLKALYKQKSKHITYDAILLVDNNAFDLYVNNPDLFPYNPPTFFCGVNDFEPSMLKGLTHITGIKETTDFEGNIKLILQLHPNTKRIVIVNENTVTGRAIKQQLLKITPKYQSKVDFFFADNLTLSDLKNGLDFIQDDDVVYLLTYNRDTNGEFLSYRYGCLLLHDAIHVPIYGSWNFYMGKGIVGGSILTGFEHGKAVANMANRVLQGEKIENIPIEMTSPSTYRFDFQELQRFNIDLKSLPKGAIIINRETKISQFYLWFWSGLLSVLFVVVAVLFSKLKYNESQKVRISMEKEKLDGKVRERTIQLENEIEERKAVEQQLRDSNQSKDLFLSIISHDLRSPVCGITQLSQLLLEDSETMSAEELRSICKSLNDQSVASYSLLEDLLTWAKIEQDKIVTDVQLLRLNELVGESISLLQVNASCKGIQIISKTDEVITFESDRYMLSTITQNLLSNAIKFTPLKGTIWVETSTVNQNAVLQIKDNGIGMNPSILSTLFDFNHKSRTGTRNEGGSGLGLSICKEFAERLQGTISAESEGENKGSTMTVIIPMTSLINDSR